MLGEANSFSRLQFTSVVIKFDGIPRYGASEDIDDDVERGQNYTHNLKRTDKVKNDIVGLRLHRKLFCRSENDMHNSKQENSYNDLNKMEPMGQRCPGSVHLHW